MTTITKKFTKKYFTKLNPSAYTNENKYLTNLLI